MEIFEDIAETATVAAHVAVKATSAPVVTPLDLEKICHYTSECSPLPTVAAEGLPHIVLYANPAFCLLVGKQQEELVGHPFAEAVPEKEENGCIALLDRVYRTGKNEVLSEQGHFTSESAPVYWSYSVWAVLDTEEHPSGVMIQVTDTTEMALFRKQVNALNEALLISSVRQHEQIEKTEGVSIRLLGIILETFHRTQSDIQVISPHVAPPINSNSVVVPVSALQRAATHARILADLNDLLMQQANVTGGGDTLNVKTSLGRLMPLLRTRVGERRIQEDISDVVLSLNKGSSLSLLVNELVSNAYQHGEGDISITLTQEDEEARLSVSDRGPGFPPHFDPEVAAHTGMDIILTLAQHALRGTIQFMNKPDGGACILVTFPL